jgi:transcriptional antiterminator RfaH
MKEDLGKKWLIAQLKPNSHDLAIRNLERQGFETFMPKMKTTVIKEDRFIYRNVFVFPGYIFIGFDSQNIIWTKINSTYGISKVLVLNKKPSEISNNLILALKQRYGVNIDQTSKENFGKGDNIRFDTGPFSDLIARVEDVDEKNRIWLIFEAMGGYRKLKLKQTEKINFHKL